MSNDESPLCVDVVDANTIIQWFDYWCEQEREKRNGIRYIEMINKLRRLTLLGASKAKRNKKAVTNTAAEVIQRLADDVRAGTIRIW